MIFLDANYIIALFTNKHKFNKKANEIYEEIKDTELIITNSTILEVMTVLNIKIKVSKEVLETAYEKLNSGRFKIIEDIELYDDTMKRMINYYPERLPFFDCLYMALMEELEIKEIATFDKHFDNKEKIIRIH